MYLEVIELKQGWQQSVSYNQAERYHASMESVLDLLESFRPLVALCSTYTHPAPGSDRESAQPQDWRLWYRIQGNKKTHHLEPVTCTPPPASGLPNHHSWITVHALAFLGCMVTCLGSSWILPPHNRLCPNVFTPCPTDSCMQAHVFRVRACRLYLLMPVCEVPLDGRMRGNYAWVVFIRRIFNAAMKMNFCSLYWNAYLRKTKHNRLKGDYSYGRKVMGKCESWLMQLYQLCGQIALNTDL